MNRTLGFNTYVEFKDSEIFAPLEDILSICGVSDRRVYYNSQRGSITVDFTPNFDTDRITVDFGLADLEGYPAERLIFDITDKAEIENIQKICSGGVFTKLEKPPPGRSPIYRISFNNGTDIYSFMENNRGVFYSACILPEGLDTCILDYARKAFDGKAYIKEYSENSTE